MIWKIEERTAVITFADKIQHVGQPQPLQVECHLVIDFDQNEILTGVEVISIDEGALIALGRTAGVETDFVARAAYVRRIPKEQVARPTRNLSTIGTLDFRQGGAALELRFTWDRDPPSGPRRARLS